MCLVRMQGALLFCVFFYCSEWKLLRETFLLIYRQLSESPLLLAMKCKLGPYTRIMPKAHNLTNDPYTFRKAACSL